MFRLLTVSRLCKSDSYKNVDQVMQALASLVTFYEFHYGIIGDGDDKVRLQDLALRLGLIRSMTFFGHVDQQTLEEAYQKCDVFVLPSTKEGCGLVFLEAMKFGKPIIAADAGATPEIVIHGETGLLMKPGDLLGLQDAIWRLMKNEELRQCMGEAGKRRYEEHFSKAKFQERVKELLT